LIMNVGEPEMTTVTDLTDKELAQQWKEIDWTYVKLKVNNLQHRIASAAKKEDWKRVNKLSRLLTNSHFAKLLAVRKVTSNNGSKTPGIDGVIWISHSDKMRAVLNLTTKGYHAKPLKRKYIPKKNGKFRPLSIPTMNDRAMQTLYALALIPIESVTSDKTSFGFKPYRSTKDAYAYLFICLSRKYSPQWIVEGDIKSCFDEISHEWILKNVPMNKKILKEFLNAGYIENSQLFPTQKGTPQGGSISPLIANITLNGIERVLGEKFYSKKDGTIDKATQNRHKINFVRFADDFVVTADSEETAHEIIKVISEFLKPRGLKLSDEKTYVTNITDGFTFLGWNFRKYNGKLLIKPSKESQKNIIAKIREVIQRGKAWSQDRLIEKLNPIIQGWAEYHSHAVASKVFSILDHIVFNMLRSWAKGRHDNKGVWWTINRYWTTKNGRKYVFATKTQTLECFSNTKIVRQRLAKLDKNPFLDKDYFENWRIKEYYRKKAQQTNTILN